MRLNNIVLIWFRGYFESLFLGFLKEDLFIFSLFFLNNLSRFFYFSYLCLGLYNWPFPLYTSKELRMRRSLATWSGLVKSATKVVTGSLRMTKVVIFVVWDLKVFLAKYEEYGTLSIYIYYSNSYRSAFVLL